MAFNNHNTCTIFLYGRALSSTRFMLAGPFVPAISRTGISFFPMPLAIAITPNWQWLGLPYPWHSFQNQHPTSSQRRSGIAKFDWTMPTDHRFLRIGGICLISMCSAVISFEGYTEKGSLQLFAGTPHWFEKFSSRLHAHFRCCFKFNWETNNKFIRDKNISGLLPLGASPQKYYMSQPLLRIYLNFSELCGKRVSC